jgi:hypothetical protein
MKKLLTVSTLLALTLVSIAPGWPPPAARAEALRLGVFDSRAVAVAYARSEIHARSMQELIERKRAAEERGDRKEVAAVEAEGARRQRRFHLQGFSVVAVDDILVHLEQHLPAVAEQAGVDAIVNRWTVAHQRPEVELVDVTEALIAPFHPDEKTLAIVRDLREKRPLDFEEADNAD